MGSVHMRADIRFPNYSHINDGNLDMAGVL